MGKMEPYMSEKHLYPMGPLTFAIACKLCKNKSIEKCIPCKAEKASGFQLDPSVKPVRVAKVKRIKQRRRE